VINSFFTDDGQLIINDILDKLNSIRFLSLEIDYKISAQRKRLFDDIIYIHHKYNDLEDLISAETIKRISQPAMRMYISRNIHPQQMEAWVNKLLINLNKLLSIDSDLSTQKSFIKDQYILLIMIIKVLNGDAYFVGCSHKTT